MPNKLTICLTSNLLTFHNVFNRDSLPLRILLLGLGGGCGGPEGMLNTRSWRESWDYQAEPLVLKLVCLLTHSSMHSTTFEVLH